MELKFDGKVNRKLVVGRSTGVLTQLVATVHINDVSADDLAKFLPAKRVHFKVFAGDKQVGEIDGHLKSISGATTKDGTFWHATVEGPLTRGHQKLDAAVEEVASFVLSLDPEEQDMFDGEEEGAE